MAEQCSGFGGDSKELMHSHPLRVDIDARNLEGLDCCVQKDVDPNFDTESKELLSLTKRMGKFLCVAGSGVME